MVLGLILLPMYATKETLRIEAMRHRDRLDIDERDVEKACALFFENVEIKPDAVVSAYWPKGKEFNTHPIIEKLLAQGNTVCLPVVREDPEAPLGFAAWDGQCELARGPLGIFQPVCADETPWFDPDVVIVPLLAFDRQGNRLGYGGGYYDRTLRHLRKTKTITAAGLAYSEQLCLFSLPEEEYDEKLDLVITPEMVYRF